MIDSIMKISLTLVAIDKMSRVIKDAVQKSNQEFQKMQDEIRKTSQQLDEFGQNIAKVGGVMTATGIGIAHQFGMTEAVKEAFQLEHRLRELANVGDLTNEQIAEMDSRLAQISRNTNQYRSEIAEGLNVLVASGIDPTAALDYMNVIGRTATAAQAEIVDISKTAFSVTDNLKVSVNDLGKTMDMLAQAGKEGRFELKDMSAAFPSLTAGAGMLGMKGVPAVAQLGAALQVAMKGAGSAAEAATNFESFLQAMTSPMTVNRFEELYGFDLPKFLNETIVQSKDPIEEIVVLINELTGGDVFAVSEIFRNKTDLNFLKPMMQNLDEYRRIKASALNAEGIMDSDFNHMMETTNEQWKQLRINMKELVFPHLHAPLAALNKLLVTINNNPILQKGLFSAIIGVIGAGVILTLVGTFTMMTGKLIGLYGTFLNQARLLTPVLMNNSVQLLKFLRLGSSAHSLETAFNIFKAGNKLNLNLPRHVLLGFGADLRRINNNLKVGLMRSFTELPVNISKFTVALKNWSIATIKGVPSAILYGLTAFKKGFLAIPGVIKSAIIAFRTFSLTLLTNPLGWIALAVAGLAFVIYKYWKPISGFFRGMWQGLKEGFAPLMPLFQRLAVVFAPIIKPIQAIINWFKKLVKPVEDTGGAAEKMGVRFGKAIANIIVKIVELITKVFEFGKKIGDMLAGGILSKIGKTKDAIGKHAQIIRDHLPHSPAKTGPLKDLHKIKISETIADAIKPMPIIKAMNNALNLKTGGTAWLSAFNGLASAKLMTSALNQQSAKANVRGASSGSVVINYNPTINLAGSTSSAKDDFAQMLKKHKEEILNIVRKENERMLRLAY